MNKRYHVLLEGEKLKNGKYIVGKLIRESELSNIYYLFESPFIRRNLILKELCPKRRNKEGDFVQVAAVSDKYNQYQEAFEYEKNVTKKVGTIFDEMKKYYVDSFEENHIQYLVVQFFEGKTLEEYKFKGIEINEVVDINISLLQFVNKLHKNDIIHGDISPDNILILNREEKVIVIDYGNTIVSCNIRFSVKNDFSAPELSNKLLTRINKNIDIYSIGATMRYLFPKQLSITQNSKIRFFDFGTCFYRWIISKCLNKNPRKRFQSCNSVCFFLYIYKFKKIFIIMTIAILLIYNSIARYEGEAKKINTNDNEVIENEDTIFSYDVIDNEVHITGSATSITNVVIPKDINGIPVVSVDGISKNIVSVDISNGITSIGDYAFMNCQYLKSVYIPESIEYIGKDAFVNCGQLKSIEISSENKFYTVWDNKLVKKNDRMVIFDMGLLND